MIKTMKNTYDRVYESPKCDITEVLSEGVLCSSFESVNLYLNEDTGKEELYQW